MDVCDLFHSAFNCGHRASYAGQYHEAIEHFTNALDFYHVCGYRDAKLWSEVLLARGDVRMRVRQYSGAVADIRRAISDCPHSVHDPAAASRWLQHAELNNSGQPVVSLHCYSAALHFSHGDNSLQGVLCGYRASFFHKQGESQKRDEDIAKCRIHNPEFAKEQGLNWKERGIAMFNERNFKNSVMALELSTKFLESLASLASRHKHLHDCYNFMASALWNSKQYSKALVAGRKCYELKTVKDKIEASRWKRKGNDILNDRQYVYAVQCYTLAIQYAPEDDKQVLGILYSNRSLAYFRNEQFLEAKNDAEKCLEYRPQWTKGYHRLGSALLEMQQFDKALDVLGRGLNIQQTADEQNEIFRKIMSVVFNFKDGPMKITFELPQRCLSAFLKECTRKEDWKTVELLFLGGGGQQSHPQGAGGIATGCDASHVSLSDLIKSRNNVSDLPKLLGVLIDHGSPLEGFGNQAPLSVAVNQKDYASALVLLEKKANINGLLKSDSGKLDDTPFHTAFRIGLSTGIFDIFSFLMDQAKDCADNPDYAPELQDKKGNSLYHLVASFEKMSANAVKGIELLRHYNVNPTLRNKSGQTPLMILRRKNERFRLIEEAVKSFEFHPPKKKKTKKKKKYKNQAQDSPPDESTSNVSSQADVLDNPGKPNKEEDSKTIQKSNDTITFCTKSELDVIRGRIEEAIDNLMVVHEDDQDGSNIIDKDIGNEEENRNEGQNISTAVNLVHQVDVVAIEIGPDDTFPSDEPLSHGDKRPSSSDELNSNVLPEDIDDEIEDVSNELFDSLTWEVECTSEVWKILHSKRLSRQMKKRIVGIIRQLANGNMRGHLAKRLEGLPKQNDILLFEAKLSRAARILWEKAIAFSPRCSNNPELLNSISEKGTGRIYSDIIRIWDIVFDHDTVPRVIERIVQSHKRGSRCIIKKELKGFNAKFCSPCTTKNQLSIPNLYAHKDDLVNQRELEHSSTTLESPKPNEVSTLFCPPGSPEQTEYHILKFYAFSNTLVSAVLDDRGKTNVDFPFRVSELEHAVINLKPNPMTSLLLLGRSGTGKTTCCVYRLWSNFQTYWQARTIDEPGFLKTVQFIPIENKNETTKECAEVCEERDEYCDRVAKRDNQDENNPPCQSSIDQTSNNKVTVTQEDAACCSQATCNENFAADRKEPAYEHLHQAFITKNAVLCTEVQKNFLDLSQACPGTCNHSEYQRSSSVNRFDQLGELSWPLFVCSRDWLLMLDASLPEPAFFPRNEEGEVLRTVKGWGEEDYHLRLIPEENSEDEYDEEDGADANPSRKRQEQDDLPEAGRTDPRLEVTYQVFKNELWPKMTKKRKVHYHPNLVWTEIRSFIKGSVEALHSEDGYLSLEEYQTLGRKRAPSFSADREIVYDLFQVYQRIKGNRRMFDEADLVYHIHRRLQGYIPDWSIHEIYVDETQDFTQAELSVIIRCCRDPNRLFFTGDTAQSIMRGVAFRFNDLKSLFYYMKESYKAVGQQAQVRVPDRVYQLTHNYRSHAGILNLASSVIELLSHFFPESFDRMERDQGLFDGPKPVLLESCSFSDLAVILRGHKRKTSPIEFGAHQVVLVASDEVRESLPEELSLALVMTIYEAKGLEFDDVLIYNFFKDSQARKEWRVVSTYNGEHDANHVSVQGIAEIPEDRLESKTRPLEFDPERHKILISEFKHLYTALTRARVNVWLFDEDEEARAPMFEYFQNLGVVEVKRLNTTDENTLSLEGMFAEKSSEEEWRKQGEFFYGKDLWKVALQCFTMAKDEEMVRKCQAQIQADKAKCLTNEPRKLKVEFLKAADLFLVCKMSDEAAICLRNARERLLLARLYQKCGHFLKAAKLFRREGQLVEASENFEKSMDFMPAVDCLLKISCYNQALDVIARCQKLIQDGSSVPIVSSPRFDQRAESICYQAAEYYLKRGKLDQMTSAIEKLPEVKDRITFLLKNGCYEQASKLLLKEGKAQEAAEMMRSNGKFLEAASYTDNDKFAAECYLLAARSAILSKKNTSDEQTNELVEKCFQRAKESYERCDDLNGQAEVKFVRGQFNGSIDDLRDAANLYFKAMNFAGLAECFLMLIDKEGDPTEKFPRQKALSTVHRLLCLILALHKKKQENKDRTVVLVCEKYFGLVDAESTHTRKIPRLEMVRFLDSDDQKGQPCEEIDVTDAYKVIKERLYKMATSLVQKMWDKHQKINEQYKPCFRYVSGSFCDETNCKHYHGNLTRQHFADRFYALCFLIKLNAMVSNFLKELKREAGAKVANRLRERIHIQYAFKGCQWLEELLFPRSGQLGRLYALFEADVSVLRQTSLIRDRIIEYAKSSVWYCAKEEARWSDSDLFVTVSNLMHVAAAPVADVFNLLSVEEKKFERNANENTMDWYGFYRKEGSFEIFSKRLEQSKYELHKHCDILAATHSAIKVFMFTPARRKAMPYPSIANAVMILEYHMIACLLLYTRYMMNNTFICLPASYLTLIKFWDLVNKSKPNQSALCSIIQGHVPAFQMQERMRKLDRLHHLTECMVKLMFGEISGRYNIFRDALRNKSVRCDEAERALILALTMLCNCGRGIPESCEGLIRKQFMKLQSRGHLPEKLSLCLEAVRESRGISDVVIALEKLLSRKPRMEKLLDVKWDEYNGKEFFRNCQSDRYPKNFRSHIDVSEISQEPGENDDFRESKEIGEEEVDDSNYDIHHPLIDDESHSRGLEYKNDEGVRKNACLVIENAVLNWLSRKRAKANREEKIRNDPVENHFRLFKLDKSGCTICGEIEFEDLSGASASLPTSSPHNLEETSSNWQPRLLKRNTFSSHCSGKSPHWKKEGQFKRFKESYRREIYPNTQKAEQLQEKMRELKKKTEIQCSLDCDRLEEALSRLQQTLKKVEKECSWDGVRLIHDALRNLVEVMERVMKSYQVTAAYGGSVEAEVKQRKSDFANRVDHREDSDDDYDEDDVGSLKDVNAGRKRGRDNSRSRRKRN